MPSIADAPEIILLNEQQIDRLYSYINEGTIREIIESSTETGQTEKGIGIKKLIQLQFGTSSGEEETEESVREIGTVGKFAILHQNLDEADDITRVSEIDREMIESLEDGQFIETRGTITASALNDVQDTFDQLLPILEMAGESQEVETEEGESLDLDDVQELLEQLNSSGDIYRQDISSPDLDSHTLFSIDSLDDESERGFPTTYTEYKILGSIEHVYEQGENESLIELADLMSNTDGRNKVGRKRMLGEFADLSSDMTDRDISRSDLEISYPDIRIRPMAIYIS